jgi:hypothetical protein
MATLQAQDVSREPRVTLDASAYPTIFSRILELADAEALIALRPVSKDILAFVDKALFAHIAIGVRPSPSGPLTTLYAPDLRSDGTPIRLPIDLVWGWSRFFRVGDELRLPKARARLSATRVVDWWAGDVNCAVDLLSVLRNNPPPHYTSELPPPEFPLPLVRLTPARSPWTGPAGAQRAKFTTTWFDAAAVTDGDLFWDALQADAERVDVHLDMTRGWTIKNSPPHSFRARHVTLILHHNMPLAAPATRASAARRVLEKEAVTTLLYLAFFATLDDARVTFVWEHYDPQGEWDVYGWLDAYITVFIDRPRVRDFYNLTDARLAEYADRRGDPERTWRWMSYADWVANIEHTSASLSEPTPPADDVHAPSRLRVTLDSALHPGILARVLELADAKALIRLRRVSKALQKSADARLFTHVAVGGRTEGGENIPTLFAPVSRSNDMPVRLPLDVDFVLRGLYPQAKTDNGFIDEWNAMERARRALRNTHTVDWWWALPGASWTPALLSLFRFNGPTTGALRHCMASIMAVGLNHAHDVESFAYSANKEPLPLIRLEPTPIPWMYTLPHPSSPRMPKRTLRPRCPNVITTRLSGTVGTSFWTAASVDAVNVDISVYLNEAGIPPAPNDLRVPAERLAIILLEPPQGMVALDALATLVLLATADGAEVLITCPQRGPSPGQNAWLQRGMDYLLTNEDFQAKYGYEARIRAYERNWGPFDQDYRWIWADYDRWVAVAEKYGAGPARHQPLRYPGDSFHVERARATIAREVEIAVNIDNLVQAVLSRRYPDPSTPTQAAESAQPAQPTPPTPPRAPQAAASPPAQPQITWVIDGPSRAPEGPPVPPATGTASTPTAKPALGSRPIRPLGRRARQDPPASSPPPTSQPSTPKPPVAASFNFALPVTTAPPPPPTPLSSPAPASSHGPSQPTPAEPAKATVGPLMTFGKTSFDFSSPKTAPTEPAAAATSAATASPSPAIQPSASGNGSEKPSGPATPFSTADFKLALPDAPEEKYETTPNYGGFATRIKSGPRPTRPLGRRAQARVTSASSPQPASLPLPPKAGEHGSGGPSLSFSTASFSFAPPMPAAEGRAVRAAPLRAPPDASAGPMSTPLRPPRPGLLHAPKHPPIRVSSPSSQSEETPARAVLDCEAFPHILDRIIAEADTSTLLRFREVSSGTSKRADTVLLRHVTVTNGWSAGQLMDTAIVRAVPANGRPLRTQWMTDRLTEPMIVDWWAFDDPRMAGKAFDNHPPARLLRVPRPLPTEGRGADLPRAETAVCWLSAADSFADVWNALCIRADDIDVHLSLEVQSGAVSGEVLGLRPQEGEVAALVLSGNASEVSAKKIVVYLDAPEGLDRTLQLSSVLGRFLSTVTAVLASPERHVQIVGLDAFRFPLHPESGPGHELRSARRFLIAHHALNMQDPQWLSRGSYFEDILPPLREAYLLAGEGGTSHRPTLSDTGRPDLACLHAPDGDAADFDTRLDAYTHLWWAWCSEDAWAQARGKSWPERFQKPTHSPLDVSHRTTVRVATD